MEPNITREEISNQIANINKDINDLDQRRDELMIELDSLEKLMSIFVTLEDQNVREKVKKVIESIEHKK